MPSLKQAWPMLCLSLCVAAHAADRTRNPHGQLKTSCEACHTATAWKPIRPRPEFNHNTETAWPLTGMHANVLCQRCHVNPIFKKTAHDCSSCHADIHSAQMGRNCGQCHTVRGWEQAGRATAADHLNRFPLLGAHATVPCERCHTGAATATFTGMSTECISCHRSDFLAAMNPPHQQSNFPLDCTTCHSMNSWTSATVNHNLFFPLTGAHATLACSQCHTGNNFSAAPTTCAGCHMADYNGTTNPNHAQAAFPTDCSLCHSTINWSGATFNHSNTVFPLTGAHVTVPCASCHVGNNYTTVPTDCYSCHKADYTGTTNPNHVASGFPTTCATCHNTTSWAGATFNHTWFPIYSGTHANVWTSCADCHLDASNYNSFSCTNCHTHNEAATDPIHKNVKGYSYTPTACYQCHPQGRG